VEIILHEKKYLDCPYRILDSKVPISRASVFFLDVTVLASWILEYTAVWPFLTAGAGLFFFLFGTIFFFECKGKYWTSKVRDWTWNEKSWNIFLDGSWIPNNGMKLELEGALYLDSSYRILFFTGLSKGKFTAFTGLFFYMGVFTLQTAGAGLFFFEWFGTKLKKGNVTGIFVSIAPDERVESLSWELSGIFFFWWLWKLKVYLYTEAGNSFFLDINFFRLLL
jgi:hypothetical protein